VFFLFLFHRLPWRWLKTQGRTDARTVDCFMTACAPAGSLVQARGVIHAADQDLPALDLLEMAFEAKVGIALREHLGVHAAVRDVATGAAFAHGLVLEDEHALLRRMTFGAVLLLRKQLCAAAGVGDAFVRRMTFHASHPAFRHGMMIGQIELSAHIQMAGVADIFNRARILHRETPTHGRRLRPAGRKAVRRFHLTAGIRMKARRTVAGFAAGIEAVLALRDEPGMVGGLEIAADFLVTLLAFGGADVFCAGHIRQHHGLLGHGAAGNRREHHRDRRGAEREIPAAPGTRAQQVEKGKLGHAMVG